MIAALQQLGSRALVQLLGWFLVLASFGVGLVVAAELLNVALILPGGLAIGFALSWSSKRLLRAWLEGRRDQGTASIMGSARWADRREVAALATAPASGLVVGREDGRPGRLLRYAGPAHLLTIAPTRAGKDVGAILPNLLTADRSIICVDPKGENARIAAAVRRRFGPVHVLDPFGISGEPASCYDPLCGLDPASPDLAEDATTLADALVHDPPDQVGEAHWNEEAKALIAGLLLHIVAGTPPEARRLATLRELLTLPPAEFTALLGRMQASTAAHGLVARAANRHLGKADREAAGVLSSAQRHTHVLDSQRLLRGMDGSDFRFADLRAGTATVFLVLPPDRLDAYARWLRLLIAQAIQELARAATQRSLSVPDPAATSRPSVLFLLDEFAALGRLEPVERAMGLMAGLGLQLWPILQDLHQLRASYGKRADSFLSNAGLIQVFGTNDVDTATWLSRTLGSGTARYETGSASWGTSSSGIVRGSSNKGGGTATHLTARPLLTPDEVLRMDPDRQVLLRSAQPPVLARKLRHYQDPEFRELVAPE